MRGLKLGQIEEQETLRAALDSGHVTDWSAAIDGGAHVGGWTKIMAEWFQTVHAFEPAPDTFEMLCSNMAGVQNVRLYNFALMQQRQLGAMRLNVRTTARRFAPGVGGDIMAVPIDGFQFTSLGLLKLDLEGCDFFALVGAEQTIKRHRPFILVEMAGDMNKGLSERFGVTDDDVRDWLSRRGYSEVFRMGVDVGFAAG